MEALEPTGEGAATLSFVAAALSGAGLRQKWLSTDLVQVEFDPRLPDLFGDGGAATLALTVEAVRANPSAHPCLPGSQAFDALVRWSRSLPCCYTFRLRPPPPESDLPRPPPVAGGKFTVTAAGTAETGYLYALFRVDLQTDERVERLVTVLVDARGRPRPDRLEAVERAPREALEPGSPRLPDGLLEQAAAAAVDAASDRISAYEEQVAERIAAERTRLDRLHRLQRDELAAELPAGPARRAAEIQGESRADADLIAELMPGDGHYSRDGLRRRLRPGPRAWFGRPAAPGSPTVEPEQRARMLRFMQGLPPAVTRQELIDRHAGATERRLGRLRLSAPERTAEAILLAEREADLEAQHQARVDEMEERLRLRVTLRPLIVEWAIVDLRRFELQAARTPAPGSPAGERAEPPIPPVEGCWNPLAADWETVPCPACGQDLEQGTLCERDHLACRACASVCVTCGRARCGGKRCGLARFQACAVCGAAACDGCGVACSHCRRWICGQHSRHCPECRRDGCLECGGGCGACAAPLCPEHRRVCGRCEGRFCDAHAGECPGCGVVTCGGCGAACIDCGALACRRHAVPCAVCGLPCCPQCRARRRCRACRSLAPVGPDTGAALRARILALSPGRALPERGSWSLARTPDRWVCVLRRWPGSEVFVVDCGAERLAAHRRIVFGRGWPGR